MEKCSTADYVKALEKVDPEILDKAATQIATALSIGRNVVVAGNGGSLAIASHFVSDLVKGIGKLTDYYDQVRCLGDNPVILTAVANDESYEEIYTEQIKGLLGSDVVVTFSVSGTSPNILRPHDQLHDPHWIAFVGCNCERRRYPREVRVAVQTDAENERYYAVCESVFSCLAHEIALAVHKFMTT